MFSFNATTGELSLKAQPDFAKKPYYEITIISKDPGGKKFAESFVIDVVPEFGALGAPDPQVLADFDQIMSENPIFMKICLLYTSPSPRDISGSRMPSSA